MSAKILVDGLNDCSNADYHADRKYLSSSVLKVLYKSLDDYKAKYIDGVSSQSSNQNALDEGTLTHAILLDPKTLETEFAFYDGLRKQGEVFEAFKAAAGTGKLIISKAQKLRVDSYVKACEANPKAMELLEGGESEQTICGTLLGVPIKVRFDKINVEKRFIADVKTTADSAELEAFKDTIEKYGYELSGALYLEMAEQFYGFPFDFYFIVISKQDPQYCAVYKLSAKTRSKGFEKIKVACSKYLTAKQTNIWTESLTSSTKSDTVNISAYEILEV